MGLVVVVVVRLKFVSVTGAMSPVLLVVAFALVVRLLVFVAVALVVARRQLH